jgi:hypothetical protein
MNKKKYSHKNIGNHIVMQKVHELYHELLAHDGFGELKIEIRILKRGQKEVIIHCGKQYRYVVDTLKDEENERYEKYYSCECGEINQLRKEVHNKK